MAGRATVIPKKNRAEGVPKEQQLSQGTDTLLEKRIRRRAHEIYLERGGEGGSDVDDWLQAEQEIVNLQEPDALLGD